jgi:hypothetical protein
MKTLRIHNVILFCHREPWTWFDLTVERTGTGLVVSGSVAGREVGVEMAGFFSGYGRWDRRITWWRKA